MPLSYKRAFILLFLTLVAHAQEQKRVAILNTEGDGDLTYLTGRLREIAVKVLPKDNYSIMTAESIIDRLGSIKEARKICREAQCLAVIGRKVNAAYIGQARVGNFGGNFTISMELYNSASGTLVDSFTGNAKDVFSLLAIIDEKAPLMFGKMPGIRKTLYLVSLNTEPSGVILSFNGDSQPDCTTPCKVELPAGSVRITGDLEEHERADTVISIKQNNQSINIRMKSDFGILEVKPAYSEGIGKDEQWSLTLNGQSFYSLENKLPADKYKGELSHRCYEDISFNIGVSKGKRQVFDMAKQVKLKKGGLVLKSEKSGEPVFVNGKQVGKTPFSSSVPLCAVVEIGKGRERVDVVLEYNGRVEHTVENGDDSRDYRASNESVGQKKTFTDSRDGKKYKIVKIGSQTWMAENLNYNANGSKCYDNDPAYCQKYGRLYNWNTAKTACPKGWHLPTMSEYGKLDNFVGGEKLVGNFLKATNGWNKNSNGEDKYGFSALPGGYGSSDGSFYYVGDDGHWWSSSESTSDDAYYQDMFYSSEGAYYRSGNKGDLYNVRCLQD